MGFGKETAMTSPGRNRDLISSVANPRVKGLVRLRNRRQRDRENAFLVEGYRELRRALAWRSHWVTTYICPALYLGGNEDQLLSEVPEDVPTIEVTEPVFRKISYRDRPEGLLAVLRQPALALSNLRLGTAPLVLVVEAAEKPGNLGAMFRTAEAAGAEAVIVADSTTDVFNPNVVRASLGSLFTLPVAVTTGPQALEWLREHQVMVVATSPQAPGLCWETDLRDAAAVVIGAEQYGLSDLWLRGADHRVRIPMAGSADSLNAASAAAVMLFEARRQRLGTPQRR